MIDIESATPDDLPEVVAILNQVAATSDASFDTRPTTVADRRGWFAVFSPTGPYRLLVARDGDGKVLGYVSSRPYRDHEAFRETVETGIALPNDASVALHRKFGFTDVGVFHEYAVKNGRYISSLWLQRRC